MSNFQRFPRPGKPTLCKKGIKKGEQGVSVIWRAPANASLEVDTYSIRFKVLGTDGLWKRKNYNIPDEYESDQFEMVIYLAPKETYLFAVEACYTDGTESPKSEPSSIELDGIEESENNKVTPKSKALGTSKEIKPQQDGPSKSIFQMNFRKVYGNEDGSIQKYEYGRSVGATIEKVVMLVGATGSGKSTLINVMINYLFGVDINDPYILRLIDEEGSEDQSKSQTRSITSYTIHGEPGLVIPGDGKTTLTIIDTPGFGDTEGIERDEQIVNQIREFFTELDVTHIDVIGFVTQASLPRLTPTQRYIFDKILSLFGKDFEDNIMMLLTFADLQKPQVLSGIDRAGFKYKGHFKFNNAALYTKKEDGNRKFDQYYWRMGEDSLTLFFSALYRCEPTTLKLTKEVLKKRHELETNMNQMYNNIKAGLNKLEQLSQELKIVEDHESEMKKNRNFKYTIDVEEVVKYEIDDSYRYTTYCVVCNRTCHDDCEFKEDDKKRKCNVMRRDGYCSSCPKQCYWSVHKHVPYIMVVIRKKMEQTSEDLRSRYAKGRKGQTSHMDIIRGIKRDFDEYQVQTLMLIDQNRQTVERLADIALKPNPMSTIDYIDTLIEAEKGDQKPGYLKRINELEELRKRSEQFEETISEGNDPFVTHREILEKLAKKESEFEASNRFGSMFNRAMSFFSIDRFREGHKRKKRAKAKKN